MTDKSIYIIVLMAVPGAAWADNEPIDPAAAPVARALAAATKVYAADAADNSDDLRPLLRLAEAEYDYLDAHVRDYACRLVKRERVDGLLGQHQFMFLKMRHERVVNRRRVVPFSVYLRFLSPPRVKGRQVLYVTGENDDKILVRKGGDRFSYITTHLTPTGKAAMRGNRYPITETGIKRLVEKLGEVVDELGDCRIRISDQAMVGDRECTHIQITQLERSGSLLFHKASVYVDNTLLVPIRFATWDWADEAGGELPLLEEYTYTHVRLNAGLSDRDFLAETYGFRPRSKVTSSP